MKTAIYLALTIFGISCKTTPEAKTSGFVEIPPSKSEEPRIVPFKLARLEGIPTKVRVHEPHYEWWQMDSSQNEFFEEERVLKNYWTVELGKLTESQFEKARKAYSSRSNQKFDPKKNYKIEDFMPPHIQALSNHRYEDDGWDTEIKFPHPFAKDKHATYTFSAISNCWNAAHEIIRGDASSMGIYYVHAKQAESVLASDRYSTVIKKLELSSDWQSDPLLKDRNQGLEPFDLMLIYGGDGEGGEKLNHVAVFIDDDFYFEKTGPFIDMNYRFTDFEQNANEYSRSFGARIEYRRYNKERLPPAEDAYSLAAMGEDFPANYVSQEFISAFPNAKRQVTWVWTNDFERTGSSFMYGMPRVPLKLNTKTGRYELSKGSTQNIFEFMGWPGKAIPPEPKESFEPPQDEEF